MDHENIPVSGEMSPADAAAWGRAITEVDEHLRAALFAWVESGDYVAEGNSDLPCIPDFMERYCGEWESFEDYARELADETGLLTDVPEEIANYFDWDSWARDLAFDYATHDNPEGFYAAECLAKVPCPCVPWFCEASPCCGDVCWVGEVYSVTSHCRCCHCLVSFHSVAPRSWYDFCFVPPASRRCCGLEVECQPVGQGVGNVE